MKKNIKIIPKFKIGDVISNGYSEQRITGINNNSEFYIVDNHCVIFFKYQNKYKLIHK